MTDYWLAIVNNRGLPKLMDGPHETQAHVADAYRVRRDMGQSVADMMCLEIRAIPIKLWEDHEPRPRVTRTTKTEKKYKRTAKRR